MKASGIFLIILMFLLLSLGLFGQQGQWTWMSGDTTINSIGHFGTKGVPDPLNFPPAMICATYWTDLEGNFWLYGGQNVGGNLLGNFYGRYYSDLWKYNVSTNMWTWVHGSGLENQPPVYGIQGIPDSANSPGIRAAFACSWTDTAGNLWLFGGSTNDGMMNDLWKYSIQNNEWTWMKGSTAGYDNGNYGVMGIPAASNNPPGRSYTKCAWIDDDGHLWLFGGRHHGLYYNGWKSGDLNDLWLYNIQTNEWTWMKGSNQLDPVGNYGIKGVADPQNNPPGREVNAHWKDSQGDFLLMGGYCPYPNYGVHNDLWKFNVASNEWTWISGSNLAGQYNICNGLCNPSLTNVPACRIANEACWSSDCGTIYMYGGMTGHQYNTSTGAMADFWSYNENTNKWTLINGDTIIDRYPVFGTKGISSSSNAPGGVYGAASWTDLQGNFWMYGGTVTEIPNDTMTFPNPNGVLWKYVPDENCPYNPGLNNISVSGDTTICRGDSITLIASGGLYYSWFPDTAISNIHIYNPFVYPQSNTVYHVDIANDGCSERRHIHVTVINDTLMSIISSDTAICRGSSLQLNAHTGYQYIWNTTATSSSIVVQPAIQTNYLVTITNALGCRAIDSVKVSVNPLPLVQLNPDPANLCTGDSITLIASGAETYVWSPQSFLSATSGDTVTAWPQNSLVYHVTGTDTNACQWKDSILVNMFPLPDLTFSPHISNICAGDTIILSASGALTYTWAPSSGLSSSTGNSVLAFPQHTTTYHVTGTDEQSCKNIAYANINVFVIPVTLGDTAKLCLGTLLTLNAGYVDNCDYLWQDGTTGQHYTVNQPGKYWVTSTANDCSRTDTVKVLICTDLWVANAFTPGTNSINDVFHAKASTELRYFRMQIFSRWGDLLFESDDIYEGWDGTWKGQLCQLGVYIWYIEYEGVNQPGRSTRKGTVTLVR